MAQPFQCSLVTPERQVFDAEVVYANLPAHDGMLGVMNHRAPLLVKLGEGDLKLQLASGENKRYRVQGGFAEMNHNRLTLLSEKADEAAE